MKICTLFLLKWKSFIRHPLIEQTITIRLLLSVYVVSIFFFLFFFGSFLELLAIIVFPSKASPLTIFVCFSLALLLLDFVLKFLLKSCDNYQYINFLRFNRSRKSIYSFIVLMEFLNLWNYYLPVFLFSFLKNNIYQEYGISTAFILVFLLCISQILISLWVSKIKSNKIGTKSLPFFLLNIFSENIISNYLLLNIKMIVRSSRLRYQLVVQFLFTAAYLYLIHNNKFQESPFPIQLLFTTLTLSFSPVQFNQLLFSAEASLFDHLMITPGFKKNLTAKYILYLMIAGFVFLLILFILPFTWESFIELTAGLLYSTGTITLLSFCCLMFVDTRIDIFSPFSKSYSNMNSVQSLVILFIVSFSIALVAVINLFFSAQVTIYFMMISGGIFILFNQLWFNYLYRCFYLNKYEKMEIFRIQ